MRRLARRYPAYGWERNAGYATLEHITVLDSIGATPHHRTSFRAKQLELLLDLDAGGATTEEFPAGDGTLHSLSATPTQLGTR